MSEHKYSTLFSQVNGPSKSYMYMYNYTDILKLTIFIISFIYFISNIVLCLYDIFTNLSMLLYIESN